MKKTYKILLSIFAAFCCVVGGAFYLLMPLEVEVETVAHGPLVEQVVEQGTLLPNRRITLNADISGTVRTLNHLAGEQISEGDAVLELDTSETKKELENQIASLKLQQSAVYSGSSSTKAELALRRKQLEQQLLAAQQEFERLFGERGIADSLLSIAQSNYTHARNAYRDADDYYDDVDDGDYDFTPGKSELYALRNQVNVARENLLIAQNNNSDSTRAYYEEVIRSCEAQLEALNKNDDYAGGSAYSSAQQLQITIDSFEEKLARGTLNAPCDGAVLNILVEEGDFVTENQPVATLYLPDSMRVETPLLAEDALSIQAGDAVQCRFADGTTAQGAVRFVSPVAEEIVSAIGLGESRCKVELVLPKLPANIGAGHQVETTFSIVVIEDALTVSSGSIIPWESGSAVYLMRDKKAVLTPVETGRQRGGRVEILSGLTEDDQVISNPYDSQVKDKSRVSWNASPDLT